MGAVKNAVSGSVKNAVSGSVKNAVSDTVKNYRSQVVPPIFSIAYEGNSVKPWARIHLYTLLCIRIHPFCQAPGVYTSVYTVMYTYTPPESTGSKARVRGSEGSAGGAVPRPKRHGPTSSRSSHAPRRPPPRCYSTMQGFSLHCGMFPIRAAARLARLCDRPELLRDLGADIIRSRCGSLSCQPRRRSGATLSACNTLGAYIRDSGAQTAAHKIGAGAQGRAAEGASAEPGRAGAGASEQAAPQERSDPARAAAAPSGEPPRAERTHPEQLRPSGLIPAAVTRRFRAFRGRTAPK